MTSDHLTATSGPPLADPSGDSHHHDAGHQDSGRAARQADGAGGDHDGTAQRRDAVVGAVIVLLVGTVLLGLVVSGRVTRYLQASFTVWLALTGAVLVGLSVWTLVACERAGGGPGRVGAEGSAPGAGGDVGEAAHDGAVANHGGHGHDHGRLPRSAALLLVPVALLAVCAPEPLGSYVLTNRTAAATTARTSNQGGATKAQFTDLPGGEAVTEIRIDKYWDRYIWGDPSRLTGKTVRVVGFVSHPEGDQTYAINRFKVFCCAADATSYTVGVQAPEDLPDDTWVEVTGSLSPASGEGHPILRATSVRRVDEPKVPYLS